MRANSVLREQIYHDCPTHCRRRLHLQSYGAKAVGQVKMDGVYLEKGASSAQRFGRRECNVDADTLLSLATPWARLLFIMACAGHHKQWHSTCIVRRVPFFPLYSMLGSQAL
jgi:hypothetical protein